MNNKKNKPHILCGKSTITRIKQTKDEFVIEKLDEQKGRWVREYTATKKSHADHKIRSGYWKDAKQFVTALFYSSGSDGYLTYTILGRKEDKLTELCKNEDIYYGDIFFEDGKLIEKRAGRYCEWRILDANPSLVPYKIPEVPHAQCIYYYLFPDGRVGINNFHYTVPIGTVVQVIRTDLNELPERKFISATEGKSDEILDFSIKNREAFKLVKEGTVEVKIVPDFDWGKAFSIIIECRKKI